MLRYHGRFPYFSKYVHTGILLCFTFEYNGVISQGVSLIFIYIFIYIFMRLERRSEITASIFLVVGGGTRYFATSLTEQLHHFTAFSAAELKTNVI